MKIAYLFLPPTLIQILTRPSFSTTKCCATVEYHMMLYVANQILTPSKTNLKKVFVNIINWCKHSTRPETVIADFDVKGMKQRTSLFANTWNWIFLFWINCTTIVHFKYYGTHFTDRITESYISSWHTLCIIKNSPNND